MKRKLFVVILLVFLFSCSILKNAPSFKTIYLLDWEKESVWLIDSTFNLVSQDPFIIAGDAPTDIFVDDENIFITNSGFRGTPTIQKYDLSGKKLSEIIRGDNSSPAYMASNENYLFVGDWLSNSLLKIDKKSFQIVDSLEVVSPQEIIYKDSYLYVGSNNVSENGFIYKISEDFKEVTKDIAKGSNPSYLDIDDEKNLYVSLVGNYNNIYGKVKKIVGTTEVDSLSFDTFLGKIKVIEDKIFVSNIFDKVYVLDKDLNIIKTFNIPSCSDLEYFKDKVVVSTNTGKIYLIDFPTLESIDSLEFSLSFKIAEMFVK